MGKQRLNPQQWRLALAAGLGSAVLPMLWISLAAQQWRFEAQLLGPAAAWFEAQRASGLRSPGPPSRPPAAAVTCPARALTVALFGQSNLANSVQPRFDRSLGGAITPGFGHLLVFDWRHGTCHPYREPLPGTDGSGGHSLTAAFLELASRSDEPVLVVPFARGGSSVLSWAEGDLAERQRQVFQQLGRRGLSPALVLWHQGESDARSLDPARYGAALARIIARSHAYAPRAWFGVALVTRCFNQGPWEPLRAAQREVVQQQPRTFLWADSDAIAGWRDRHDGCHFSARGARRLSHALLESLKNQQFSP